MDDFISEKSIRKGIKTAVFILVHFLVFVLQSCCQLDIFIEIIAVKQLCKKVFPFVRILLLVGITDKTFPNSFVVRKPCI